MADWLEEAKEQHEEQRVRNSEILLDLPRLKLTVVALSYRDGTDTPKTVANPVIVRTNKAGLFYRKGTDAYLVPWHQVLEVKLGLAAPIEPTP